MGRLVTHARSQAVDFREQRGIYVLYDDTFKIVYLGQAGGRNKARLFGRLKIHKRDHLAQRWSRFSWFGVCPVEDNSVKQDFTPSPPSIPDILNHIEGMLLAAAEPTLNLQRGRFGKKVQQYLQLPLNEQHDVGMEEGLEKEEATEFESELDNDLAQSGTGTAQ